MPPAISKAWLFYVSGIAYPEKVSLCNAENENMDVICHPKKKEEENKFMTMGELMFYGGIVGTTVFGILFFALWGVFEKKKKKLRRQIEEEY